MTRVLAAPPAESRLQAVSGDGGLPVVGHTLNYIRDPLALFQQRWNKYGEVSWMTMAGKRWITVLGPDACQEVLQNKDRAFVNSDGWSLLIGPFFLRPTWRKETTIGTLALCQSLGHAFKLTAFATIGFQVLDQAWLMAGMTVGVIAGTGLGRGLHHFVQEKAFRPLFKGVLVLLAVKLLWDAGRRLLGA